MKPILLADDDPMMVDLYTRKFKKLGWPVEVAMDGEEAVAKAGQVNPTIILLDRILPKLDGMEVLEKLHADDKTKNIPVIVLTNLEEDQAKIAKLKELGAVDYIIKEKVDLDQIAEKITAFLKTD